MPRGIVEFIEAPQHDPWTDPAARTAAITAAAAPAPEGHEHEKYDEPPEDKAERHAAAAGLLALLGAGLRRFDRRSLRHFGAAGRFP